ncbi:T-cell ecto-ADP-ribosyltransferase 1 isoform X3 [Mus caroli]|uniref:NAD(P)(+)--arginine ADP-ribosyltransferase n=1 Tax=Mus caroli TaxID=10089 RepID=A0A6P7RDK8_MUSCR|nr:T-cell ecto-ADP-ribosyltransferase 1 isoform X3 [Mus caroli]
MTSKIFKFFLTWWLTQQVTGLTGPVMLDMAPNAFDDQYEGCVEDMEKRAPQLLQEDFNMNEKLKLEWKKAEIKWKEIKNCMSYPQGFHDFHGTALVAYTGEIFRSFNEATREFKVNPGNFHYKAFHYYLTRALQLLSDQRCSAVYRDSPERKKSNFNCVYSGSTQAVKISSLESRESCASLFLVVLLGLLVQQLTLAEL